MIIGIGGSAYKAHRLAILYVDGYMPEGTVDHIDRCRDHNWYDNLREASHQIQRRNSSASSTSKSGVKGVCFDICNKRWKAFITVNYHNRHLGLFTTLLEAAYHRYAAEQCLGWEDENSSAKQFIFYSRCLGGGQYGQHTGA